MYEVDTIDFFTNSVVAQDPYPFFELLRAKGPVHREPFHGVVVVTGYEEAVAIFDDHKRFSSCNAITGPFPGLPFKAEGSDVSGMIERHRSQMPFNEYLVTHDRPQHSVGRSLLTRFFTPSRLRGLEGFMAQLADEYIDELFERGECELVSAYAHPYATLVIAHLLGVPNADRELFRRRFSKNWQLFAEGSSQEREKVLQQPFEFLKERFTTYLIDRRNQPQKDVLTDLQDSVRPDGSTVEIAELVQLTTFLFAAGQDTSALLMTSVLRVLGERPDLQQQLRDERWRIPNFIEETLRLESPVKSIFRLARVPVTIGGCEIPAGSAVMILVGAANRDPRRFSQPDQFLLERPKDSDHLSFGRGIHACIGNSLARLETRVSLERMLDRTAEIKISQSEHGAPDSRRYEFEATYILRKLKGLHLDLIPATVETRAKITA